MKLCDAEAPFSGCCRDESDDEEFETDSDENTETPALREVQKPPAPAPGPPAKVRIAYLDHIKLICMTSVWWIHGMAYAAHYCRYPTEEWSWPDEMPHHATLLKMLHKYNMCLFAFCSGSVSYSEATPERLASSFNGLILPCILVALWLQCTWYLPAKGKLGSGAFGFLHNSEPWYMKTLFGWRILLFSLGYFTDVSLVCLAIGTRIVWQVTGQTNDPSCLLPHVVNDFPFFVMGHVLVRRRKLLEPYVNFLRERRWLQKACLFGYIALWLDVLCVGLFASFDSWFWSFFPAPLAAQGKAWNEVSYATLAGLAFAEVFRIIEVFTYGFVATGWLPTDEKPVFSSTGKYTLYAYLLNYHGIIVFLSLWKTLFPPVSVSLEWTQPLTGWMGIKLTSLDLWWTSWMGLLPFFTMFLCSEPVRFILWPIMQPSWFGKDYRTTKIEDVADVDWVKKVGFKKWAAVEVAFHVCWITLMIVHGMPFRDGCEERVPSW
jgi:hypothetical protein